MYILFLHTCALLIISTVLHYNIFLFLFDTNTQFFPRYVLSYVLSAYVLLKLLMQLVLFIIIIWTQHGDIHWLSLLTRIHSPWRILIFLLQINNSGAKNNSEVQYRKRDTHNIINKTW